MANVAPPCKAERVQQFMIQLIAKAEVNIYIRNYYYKYKLYYTYNDNFYLLT